MGDCCHAGQWQEQIRLQRLAQGHFHMVTKVEDQTHPSTEAWRAPPPPTYMQIWTFTCTEQKMHDTASPTTIWRIKKRGQRGVVVHVVQHFKAPAMIRFLCHIREASLKTPNHWGAVTMKVDTQVDPPNHVRTITETPQFKLTRK